MLGQVLGDDRCRNAAVAEFAVQRQARRHDRGLDRVQHVETGRQLAEPVPVVLGADHPVFLRADAVFRQMIRAPYLEPPVLAHSWSTLRIARRKSSASRMLSSTSAVPPGGSIIAAATSHDAMIAYCGEVEVCIR